MKESAAKKQEVLAEAKQPLKLEEIQKQVEELRNQLASLSNASPENKLSLIVSELCCPRELAR
jgi:DNA repair exonuclease SbcCD ATPase subunit